MNNELRLWLGLWLSRLNGKMEIRPISREGRPVVSFFASQDRQEIERFVEANEGANLYFGVLGRTGTTGGKDSIKEAHCLWIDIDFKDLPGGQTEADGIIATFDIRPSLQISSGGGYHLYWFLEEPTTDLARIERILKGLSKRLKSDPKVAQIASILRIPYTMNWKYTPARKVEIIQILSEETYSLDEFSEWEIKDAPATVSEAKGEYEDQFDLRAYLKHHKVPVVRVKKYGSSTLYCLKTCLFDENHTVNHGAENDAAIGQQESGLMFYQCFHANCADKTWSDVRRKISGDATLTNFIARDIKALVTKFAQEATGVFAIGFMTSWLDIRTPQERNEAWQTLKELTQERIIVPTEKRHGEYRPVDRNPHIMRLGVKRQEPVALELPLNLHEIVKLYPKNVILVAGEKDAGKTSFAMNAAYMNREIIPVRYINSEMGEKELEDRIILFPDRSFEEWNKIAWIEKSSKFEDVIEPNALNIIDFLEIGADAYAVADDIKRVFDRLEKGLIMILMQKRSYKEFAVGGEATLEKARLAVNLERRGTVNVCKITVAKNWTGLISHPKGYECAYKIVSGGKMTMDKYWHRPEAAPENGQKNKRLKIVSKRYPSVDDVITYGKED